MRASSVIDKDGRLALVLYLTDTEITGLTAGRPLYIDGQHIDPRIDCKVVITTKPPGQ